MVHYKLSARGEAMSVDESKKRLVRLLCKTKSQIETLISELDKETHEVKR